MVSASLSNREVYGYRKVSIASAGCVDPIFSASVTHGDSAPTDETYIDAQQVKEMLLYTPRLSATLATDIDVDGPLTDPPLSSKPSLSATVLKLSLIHI